MVIPRNLVAVAALMVVTTTWASPLPDPQGRGVISVYRSGNGVAAGSTYNSGSGGGGFVGTSVHSGSPGGFVGTSVRSGGPGFTGTAVHSGGGGPGQVYVYRSGNPGFTRYNPIRSSPGVTFHRFSSPVFPRSSFFDGFGVGVGTGTGAYAGGGTGAFAGAGGAFASAGGLGVWAGK